MTAVIQFIETLRPVFIAGPDRNGSKALLRLV